MIRTQLEVGSGEIQETDLYLSPKISLTLKLLSRFRYEAFLVAFFVLLCGAGLLSFEFFRHTEADRVLIASEMLASGNLVVPHLLGQTILSKPPLFYWLLSGTFSIFSSNSEWIARLPSALCGVLFVQAFFCFLKLARIPKQQAFVSTLIFGTTPLFLQLSSAAEIDLLFVLLLSSALFSIFFTSTPSFTSYKNVSLFLAYGFSGLAALAKGPVSIVLVFFIDLIWFYINKLQNFRSFIFSRILALTLAVGINLLWIIPAAREIGWDPLFANLIYEITRRFSGINSESHGSLFYIQSISQGFLPWSFIFALSLFINRRSITSSLSDPLFKYALLCSSLIIFVLSLALGKSSRYSFPAYPFLVILITPLVFRFSKNFWRLSFIGYLHKTFLALIILSSAVSYFYFGHQLHVIVAAIFCITALLIVASSKRILELSNFLVFLLSLTIVIRFGECGPYAAYRNYTKSIISDVSKMNTILAESEKSSTKQIYILELPERWYAYYLERQGTSVFLINSENKNILNNSKEVFLLLSKAEELWRVQVLKDLDPSSEVIPTLESSKVILMKTSAAAISRLKLQSGFPTTPSPVEF